MKPRFAPPIAFCIAVLIPILVNAAEPPKGFRSLNWGASPASGLKKLSGSTSDGTSLYVQKSSKTPAPLLEIPVAEEAYSFSHGKFYSGSAWLDGKENFDKMKAALTKAYGTPLFSNGRDLYKWKWLGTKIEVSLYFQAKFARTTVTFLNDAI
jgi:hypothetical protein